MIHRKLCRVYWLSGQELLEPLNENTMPAYYTLLLVIPMVSLVLDTLIGVWMRGPPTELFWLYLVLLGLKLAVNLGRCPQRSSKNRVPIGSTAR
jgi:C4-dicarboxylate transporter